MLPPPRLLARNSRKRPAANNTTSIELRQMAGSETAPPYPPFGVLTEEAYLSWEARKRRMVYYYVMCTLCIFPFIAPLIYWGTFDSALSWITRGETARLTRRQRRNVVVLGALFSAAWLVALAVLVTLVVTGKQNRA